MLDGEWNGGTFAQPWPNTCRKLCKWCDVEPAEIITSLPPTIARLREYQADCKAAGIDYYDQKKQIEILTDATPTFKRLLMGVIVRAEYIQLDMRTVRFDTLRCKRGHMYLVVPPSPIDFAPSPTFGVFQD